MNQRIYALAKLRVDGRISAKGSKPKKPKAATKAGLDASGIEMQNELFGQAGQMGQGKWFEAQPEARRAAFQGLAAQSRDTRFDTRDALSRAVPGDDKKINRFVNQSVGQDAGLRRDDMKSFFRDQQYNAQQAEIPFRSDLDAASRHSAGQMMGMYNQQLGQNAQIQSQMGTFASNIAGGLGEGAGWMASLEYAKRFGG